MGRLRTSGQRKTGLASGAFHNGVLGSTRLSPAGRLRLAQLIGIAMSSANRSLIPFVAWIHACRDDWMPRTETDCGQASIFQRQRRVLHLVCSATTQSSEWIRVTEI